MASDEHHEDHAAQPIGRDPDLPQADDATLRFIAAGALVVYAVALFTLLD